MFIDWMIQCYKGICTVQFDPQIQWSPFLKLKKIFLIGGELLYHVALGSATPQHKPVLPIYVSMQF